MNFASLDYLIKDYSFSYSYSSTLHFDYFNKDREAQKDLIAFSPQYNPDIKNLNSKSNTWSSLFPLSGAKEEVQAISEQIDTEEYIDALATETQFKKSASQYDILHLAMHTLVNDSIPMYSKLVFSDTKDSLNDNLLNTEEIYNMHLKARMAVLSACNTGTGKLHRGEGVMSLARGFLYAGCPSIVMTLWEVDDKSGAQIMNNFYAYLKDGKSKNEALRLAKLEHLKNADSFKAHPYFWLSYVIVGDSTPLYHANELYFFIFLIAALLVWLGYEYRISRKKKCQVKK
jgi:CHAT domain-containing protein